MGAETSDCDSPFSLINATFDWIDENLKDSIDFIIWTGDSARHDNDECIPRSEKQVLDLNALLVTKFVEVFGKGNKLNHPTIPIVPNLGNNDILPHNILAPGPNKWTKNYLSLWEKFIPEEQRHGFDRGGWFFVEVIPKKLAAFSLNTLYFFDRNTAVDGCSRKSQPGYEQMEWLRIQLQFLRERGMKAIISGHVPPARTESKHSWDETCWYKYTFWMKQYRDVVAGSLYGHMNIDHFLLQDYKEVDRMVLDSAVVGTRRSALDEDLAIQSSASYLTELRYEWSRIPDSGGLEFFGADDEDAAFAAKGKNHQQKSKKSKKEKFFDNIGGPWGERYSTSLVSPSVVPNYFPTLRVIEYNITGLETRHSTKTGSSDSKTLVSQPMRSKNSAEGYDFDLESKRRKHRSHKKPKFTIPDPPSKSSPPGPAYSPQTFTWLGYTQYYANLTVINNDFVSEITPETDSLQNQGWHKGKHSQKKPKEKGVKPHPREFIFQIEYDTKTDKVFGLKDLTTRSLLKLAGKIGQYRSQDYNAEAESDMTEDEDQDLDDGIESDTDDESLKDTENGVFISTKKHKKHKHRNHKKRKVINHTWFTFVKRAFVSSIDDEEIHDNFGE